MVRKLVLAVSAACVLVAPAFANGIYLDSNIRPQNGGKGEFDDQVPLLTLDWGLIVNPEFGQTRPGGCQLQPITVTKDIDSTSVQFIEAAALSKQIGDEARITLTRKLGYDSRDPEREFPVLQLLIEDAFITTYKTAVSKDSFAMAETIQFTSRVNRTRAVAFEYNTANGRLLRSYEVPITCSQPA